MWSREPTPPVWRNCRRPFSFYHQLIDRYWAEGPGDDDAPTLHRLCTLARKMGVRSVLVEDAFSEPALAPELEHLEAASRSTPDGALSALKITFLTVGAPARGQSRTFTGEDVIGQAIIVSFPVEGGRHSYVYEAIFRPPRGRGRGRPLLLNNYVPIQRVFKICAAGQTVEIPGSVYAQQNGVTSVCAHAAVRALIKTYSGVDVSVAELNGIWEYDTVKRSVGANQLPKAFAHVGLRAVTYNLQDRHAPLDGGSREDLAWRTLGGIIESGSPGLLVVDTPGSADHVVSLVGFTLNTDEWHPLACSTHLAADGNEVGAGGGSWASQESSSAWIDHLVIHDEALGPYYCLSRGGLFEPAKSERPIIRPLLAVAILPEDVEVSPAEADHCAKECVARAIELADENDFGSGRWWKLLKDPRQRQVFRATLISREDYGTSLRRLRGADDVFAEQFISEMLGELPDRFWLCEVTLPQLFVGNRAKLGEILLRVDKHADKAGETLIGYRFPGLLCWRTPNPDSEEDMTLAWFSESGHAPLQAAYHSNGW